MIRSAVHLLAVLTAGAVVGTLSGCSEKNDSSTPGVAVDAGDDTCAVEKTTFDAGPITFDVTNSGSDVTEVYVYGEKDGHFSQIVDEVENIGPGTSRELDVDLEAGRYHVTCKPGMVGDGIATMITVKADADKAP